MLEFADFGSVNPRFLLPVREIDIRFSFNEVYLQEREQIALRNILAKALLAATAGYSDIGPAEIQASRLIAAPRGDSEAEEGEQIYAFGQVTSPVYGFAVQITRRTLRLVKINTSLNNLISTLNVMREVVKELTPSTNVQGSFIDFLDLRNQFHGSSFRYKLELSLGVYESNRTKQATNVDLISRLLRAELGPGDSPVSAPLGALQLETIRRANVIIMGGRTLGTNRREVVLNIECPYNISQKDVDLAFTCRTGNTDVPFQFSHLHDFETPAIHFYRDLILENFMEQAFGSVSVEARL